MKITRTLGLLLGALCGAAAVTFGTTTKITAATTTAARPADYRPVATMQVLDTMKGKKRIIDWTVYVDFDGGGTPTTRTTAWLEGDFQASANGIELWEVGAQHRTHQLWVRLVPKHGHTASLMQVTDSLGQPVTVTPPQDSNGFYLIESALPNGGTTPVNSYKITTTDPKLHLDVQYVGHAPGAVVPKQTEDGGPPSVPPVHEN